MQQRVEVVICNFRRPGNIPAILAAFRGQSVRPKITLVNCPVGPGDELDPAVLNDADEVYSSRGQHGGWTRFNPFWNFDREFTYFHDDDILPGSRLIEHWLRWADAIGGFGVLGQRGRITRGYRYTSANEPREAGPKEVDVAVEGYFAKTELMPLMFPCRRAIMEKGGRRGCDILLCTALKIAGHRTFLTPASSDPEERMAKERLCEDFGLSADPEHLKVRQGLIDAMRALGWRSCSDDGRAGGTHPARQLGRPSAGNEPVVPPRRRTLVRK